jgi:ribosomal protein S27AE
MPITGDQPGKGAYKCLNCGEVQVLGHHETLPPCGKCGFIRFSQVGISCQDPSTLLIPDQIVFPDRRSWMTAKTG